MLLRPACCILLTLPALWLGGCADTISETAPPSASTLARDYEKTLTPEEREAAISDLRSETSQKEARKGDQAGQN